MSHFTVLLTNAPTSDEMDNQLLPFCEDTSVLPKACLHFEDTTDAYLQEYETGGKTFIMAPNGEEFSAWEILAKTDTGYEVSPGFESSSKRADAWKEEEEGWSERFELFSNSYSTFEEFCEEYHGEKPNSEGRYGYTSNTNAKWDWYCLGGRWRGYFQAKPGHTGVVGDAGVFDNEASQNGYDWIEKESIDFSGMMEKASSEATQNYLLYKDLIAIHGVPRSSSSVLDEVGEENPNQFREIFWQQPIVLAMQEKKLLDHFCSSDRVDSFGTGSDEEQEYYVETARLSSVIPYAILHEGQWYQRGEMGWFGCSNNEMTQGEWVRKAWSILESLPQDSRLALMDCHI